MKKLIPIILVVFIVLSCKNDQKQIETKTEVSTPEIKAPKVDSFVDAIETAHKKNAFLTHDAVQYDINLTFGGQQILDATVTVSTDSRYSIISLKNGESLYIIDDKVYVSEGLKEDASVRFSAYTWNYFFLFPYKLDDDGTKWTDYTPSHPETNFNTKKLTFENGIGDAPEDWYVVYSNKDTNVIEHAAYIVTFGKTKEEAETDPHAIQYLDYKDIEGIPFAHDWVFLEWQDTEGLTNEIGNAKLNNIQFVDNFKSSFAIPEGFVEK